VFSSMPTNHRFLAIALIGTMAAFAMTRLKTQIGRIIDRFIIVKPTCVLYGGSSHCMLQTRSRKPSLARLVDLPLEVLVEILVLLEWKDVLRVRQVRIYFIQILVLMRLVY
jgi:hypothetical protein